MSEPKKKLSGGELVEQIAELRRKFPKENDRDWARRIYKLVHVQLKDFILSSEIPVWLVWERRQNGELQLDQLRAIDTDMFKAKKHEKMLESENETLDREGHVHIEQTTLNHLFAWTMVQKLRVSDVAGRG
jgi:hypothetical protein